MTEETGPWGHKETEQLSTHIKGCGPRMSQPSTPQPPGHPPQLVLSPAPHSGRGIHWGPQGDPDHLPRTPAACPGTPQGSAVPTLKSLLLAAHILLPTPPGKQQELTACRVDRGLSP